MSEDWMSIALRESNALAKARARIAELEEEVAMYVLRDAYADQRIAELEALLWDVCGCDTATAALPLSLCARIDAALGDK